jgi:LysM repeat protein
MSEDTGHLFAGHDPADTGHHLADDSGHTVGHAAEFDVSQLDVGAFDTGADAVHGSPTVAHDYWFHQQKEDCVPASVTQVLSEVVGHPVSEQDVLDRMTALGETLPTDKAGVPFLHAEELLQSFGVDCHYQHQASVDDLKQYLDQGRSVIVSVDPDPIWYPGQPDQGEGHAVMITAIDETTGMVTLDDTGSPQGNEEQVPLDQFEHAWAEHQNDLVVTDSPTVEGHPGPVLTPVTVSTAPPTADTPAQSYTVQPGDTLWDIAERVYGDPSKFTEIAQASGISDPNHIEPGQTLTIPAKPE